MLEVTNLTRQTTKYNLKSIRKKGRKEGRKGMFYLMMHTTHFILRLDGGHMVKDHSESYKKILLPPLHGLLFLISSKGYFYMHHPTDRIYQPWSTGWKEIEIDKDSL